LVNPLIAPDDRPWGFFATISWGVLILVVAGLAQKWAYTEIWVAGFPRSPTDRLSALTGGLLASCLVGTTLTLAVTKLRRGYTPMSYLGLRRVPWRKAAPWISLGVVASLLGIWSRDAGPDSNGNVNLLAQDHFLLYLIAFVLLVPFFEEINFRGFLLTGLRNTRLGDPAGIAIAAALWAALHFDSTWLGFTALFVLGCILGVMRTATQSILPGLCVHVFSNAVSLSMEISRGLP
jgi:membrane protease YdiL (CAAX protease family)